MTQFSEYSHIESYGFNPYSDGYCSEIPAALLPLIVTWSVSILILMDIALKSFEWN